MFWELTETLLEFLKMGLFMTQQLYLFLNVVNDPFGNIIPL